MPVLCVHGVRACVCARVCVCVHVFGVGGSASGVNVQVPESEAKEGRGAGMKRESQWHSKKEKKLNPNQRQPSFKSIKKMGRKIPVYNVHFIPSDLPSPPQAIRGRRVIDGWGGEWRQARRVLPLKNDSAIFRVF